MCHVSPSGGVAQRVLRARRLSASSSSRYHQGLTPEVTMRLIDLLIAVVARPRRYRPVSGGVNHGRPG